MQTIDNLHKVTLTITVDRDSAIRAGHSQHGSVKVVLDDEDIAQLSQEERDALILHCSSKGPKGGPVEWGSPLTVGAAPLTVAPDLNMVRGLLRARIHAMGGVK